MPAIDQRFVKSWTTAMLLIGLAVVLLVVAPAALFVTFAGILVGILLVRCVRVLHDRVRVPYGLALVLVVLLGLAVVGGAALLIIPNLIDQFHELVNQVPKSWEKVRSWLSGSDFGRRLLELMPEPEKFLARAWDQLRGLSGFLATLIGAIAGLLATLMLGLYFAIDPAVYRRGVLRLMPRRHRGFAEDVITRGYRGLGNWLLAKLASMVFIGILSGVGLWILDVPLALGNGVLAGVLAFIPNFGPIASAIPPILLALAEDPMLAVWVVVLYGGIQFVESYALTPNVMRMVIHLPQALILTAQLVFGTLFGLPGLIFAVPLALTIMLTVDTWIEQREAGTPSDDGGR